MSKTTLLYKGTSGPIEVSSTNPLPVTPTSSTLSNPEVIVPSFTQYIMNQQGFAASTGLKAAVATGLSALSIFNPANSGKTAVILTAMIGESSGSYHQLTFVTSDPNFNGTNKGSITPVNMSAGSSTTSVCNVTFSNTGAEAVTGTLVTEIVLAGTNEQFFTDWHDFIVFRLPPGNGAVMWVSVTTNNWTSAYKWIESAGI